MIIAAVTVLVMYVGVGVALVVWGWRLTRAEDRSEQAPFWFLLHPMFIRRTLDMTFLWPWHLFNRRDAR